MPSCATLIGVAVRGKNRGEVSLDTATLDAGSCRVPDDLAPATAKDAVEGLKPRAIGAQFSSVPGDR